MVLEKLWILCRRYERFVFDRILWKNVGNPDVIIVDPPRAGMHPDVVRQLS